MAVKYIQKNDKGLWTISNSKSGKVIRTTNTQKEAITIAGSTKTTEAIMIKRSSGWGPATGWDQQIANSTKSATTLKKDKGVTKPATKKPAAKKPVTKKPAAKKPAAKKATTKKPATKTTTTKTTTTKKTVSKKPETKKKVDLEEKEKVVVNKPIEKKEIKKVESKPVVEKAKSQSSVPGEKTNGKLNGYWALLIGILIIAVAIGGTFLLGHLL